LAEKDGIGLGTEAPYPAFRSTEGQNWVVCQDVQEGYAKQIGKIKLEFLGLEEFTRKISKP